MKPPRDDFHTPLTVISFTSSPDTPAGRAPGGGATSPPRDARLTNGSRRPDGSEEYPAPCGGGGCCLSAGASAAAGGFCGCAWPAGACGAAGPGAPEFFVCAVSLCALASFAALIAGVGLGTTCASVQTRMNAIGMGRTVFMTSGP